jgi:hypothetical protein
MTIVISSMIGKKLCTKVLYRNIYDPDLNTSGQNRSLVVILCHRDDVLLISDCILTTFGIGIAHSLQESSESKASSTEHERSSGLNGARVSGGGAGARRRRTTGGASSSSGSLARSGGSSRATSRDGRLGSIGVEL